MIEYQIDYLESVVKEDIPRLSKSDSIRVQEAIEKKLRYNPIEFGKPLRYSLKGVRSLRVGDIRIIFTIQNLTVLIVKIGHRKKVYGGH